MFTRLVCGNGRNNKHKECCFVVPRNLLSLTMIREQMAEAVSWLVSPGKQEVGDDKRLVISLSGASLPQALPERIDASLKPHLWSLVQYFIFFFSLRKENTEVLFFAFVRSSESSIICLLLKENYQLYLKDETSYFLQDESAFFFPSISNWGY